MPLHRRCAVKKISVIVPVYNMEMYFKVCMESIIKQSIFKDSELVCVNAGSTDGSLYVLREYESHYDNLILINHLNIEVGVAHNTEINAASCKIFQGYLNSNNNHQDP